MARKEGHQSNYFIAIVPPSPVYEQAQNLKLHFRDNYQSKASLNSPPHITLHMPFRWKEKKEDDLINTLSDFTADFSSFSICLKNFSCFSPKVIFIDIETSPRLNELQTQLHKFCKRELNIFNADYKEQPFYPHITLAFRDLKKPAFHKAWEEFKDKDFRADFLVEQITLLKHTGKVWQIFKEFVLMQVPFDVSR
ncbi:MAG TPA: 2'-5' RNA ligase family protein [Cyclobacteriaceae bacterium]|nr:2'-5' RNA ligase family protein [Cyclobacteriaceae bacterium]